MTHKIREKESYLSKSYSNISDADNGALAIGFITVTDGKIPMHINFTLNVNPSAESLPDGFGFANGVYTHTVRTLSGDGSIEIVNGGLELTQSCVNVWDLRDGSKKGCTKTGSVEII